MKGCIQSSNSHVAVALWITQPHAKLLFEREKLRNYIQNGATTKNWSRSNAFFSCDTSFFPAMHVSKGFGPDTVPIRPRYGPATGPIRPRYGHRSAFFQKFNRQRLAFFEKIGTLYIKNWLELSVVKSLGLICHDLFCFCELYVMEKLVDLCENEKVRNQTSWRYFFEAMPPCLWQKSSMKTTALVLR